MKRPTPPPPATAESTEPGAVAAVWTRVSELKPWIQNPRVNTKAVPKVMALIERVGFGAPVLVRRENNEIIGGHTRLEAAVRLGLETVPVRFLDLSEADAHLMALGDNRASEASTWDQVLARRRGHRGLVGEGPREDVRRRRGRGDLGRRARGRRRRRLLDLGARPARVSGRGTRGAGNS